MSAEVARQGALTGRRATVLGAAVLVVAFALGALWPYGGEKSGEAASEDSWRIEARWETAEPGAVPTKDAAGGDDALTATLAHSYRIGMTVQPDGAIRTEVVPIEDDWWGRRGRGW